MRINGKVKRLLDMRRADGMITVEAAILLPFVMLFVLAFVVCIRLFMVELALQTAVSETVKTVAAQMTIVEAVRHAGLDLALQSEYAEHVQLLVTALPHQAAPRLFRSMLRQLANERLLDVSRIRIVDHQLPLDTRELPFQDILSDFAADTDKVRLSVEYPVVIKLPFYEKELLIRASAMERAWIGGWQ